MQREKFSFFDDEEAKVSAIPKPENDYEEIYYKDIWFWCKTCWKEHRWTECPKPNIV